MAAIEAASASVDPRGPIAYPGARVMADATGVYASDFAYRPEGRKPSAWRGRWIWLAGDPRPAAALFRKEIALAEAPARVHAWISADRKYRLYVNGRLASRGPVDIGMDYAGGSTHRWFYDCRDLTAYFHKGRNAISAEVFREWPIGFTASRGRPGLLFEAEAALPGNGRRVIASDSSWRGIPAPQYPDPSTYDAAREPAGWRSPGFDDGQWQPCRTVQSVWENLTASEIPQLMEARYPPLRIEGLPARVLTADGSFRVVFDRVLSGYPTIKLRGGKGARLTIRAQRSATMLLGDGEQYFEFPFLTEIAPAFKIELSNVTTPVEILDVGANFTSQPVVYRGQFACSDPKLTRLWDVSRWAVQICLQSHHLDSPNHQEPISDPGDYVIESMVNYYAFGQPWLARQDLRKFAWLLKDERYCNFHISYSLAWLQMLMDYYDFTGDKALVVELAPYVHGLMDRYASWRGANGLISEAPDYMFMDWVTIGGFECHHPPAVVGQGYLTALYCHGLTMASRVAALMGDGSRAREYARQRMETAAAFNRELWSPERKLYRDGRPFQTHVKPHQWLPADKDIETFSPHVNLLAVLFDLAPKERQRPIVESVLSERPLNTQPWFMHWVFQAIDHAGLFDKLAPEQLARWRVVPETRSFHEMWEGGDLSHGWCSTPLVQLSSHILGVAPSSPGFKSIAVRPHLCGLKWVMGCVPTPLGDVVVNWNVRSDRFEADVTVPEGATADFVLPSLPFPKAVVRHNGRRCGAKVHLGPGAHHIAAREAPNVSHAAIQVRARRRCALGG